MLKIGFTGTRNGMTEEQKQEFGKFVSSKEFEEFHHGMCVGSDEQAHCIIKSKKPSAKIVGHPPKYKAFEAILAPDETRKPYDYLKRNHNIVDDADIIVATPDSREKTHSGTWSTVRYARKRNKKIYIIHKNGRVNIEGGQK